jgi:hypothetical protein
MCLRLGAPLLAVALALPNVANAQPVASTSASARTEPSQRDTDAPTKPPPDAELPALPTLAPIKLAEPTPEASKELESLLERLVSAKPDVRERAREALAQPSPALVPALHAKIQDLRGSLDRERAPKLLEAARKAARDDRKKAKKKGTASELEDDDWLLFLHASPATDDPAWRELVQLLGCVRLLGAIGTTEAVRELLHLRANFGEMLRLDLSRQITKLGDRAVAALHEAKRHDAVIVQRFAALELDKLGRVTPGEAVAVRDPDALADVLRAFGRNRDVDAVGVLLSFANHDRKKVREAAREALSGIGDAARWQLRDAWQDLSGEKAERGVPWDVLAKRIFWAYDQSRLAELERLADEGFDAAKSNDHTRAVGVFDRVLARDPLFERRRAMSASYVAVARATPIERGEERLAMLRKARRLDPESKDGPKLDADIAYVEAKLLIADGRPDRYLLERAVELDPEHAEARSLLAGFEEKALVQREASKKGLAAAAVAGATVLMLAIIALWGRWRRPKAAPQG